MYRIGAYSLETADTCTLSCPPSPFLLSVRVCGVVGVKQKPHLHTPSPGTTPQPGHTAPRHIGGKFILLCEQCFIRKVMAMALIAKRRVVGAAAEPKRLDRFLMCVHAMVRSSRALQKIFSLSAARRLRMPKYPWSNLAWHSTTLGSMMLWQSTPLQHLGKLLPVQAAASLGARTTLPR